MPIDRARYRRMAVIGHPCHESPSTRGLTTPTIVLYDGHINHNREEHIMQKSAYDQRIDALELHAGSLGWDHGLGNPHDYAPLSGEWADSMTPAALYRELGFTPEEWPEWVAEHLCNTFEEHAEQARAVSAMDD